MYNIELEKALDLILENTKPIEETEIVDLDKALGRIIAKDFYAPMSNPPFDKSPLDGFALRGEDLKNASEDHPVKIQIIDEVFAGSVSHKVPGKNQGIRIMTGGQMPKGTDCVIRLEDVEEDENSIFVSRVLKPYENYCYKGEDINEGELLIEEKTRLNSIHLGVLGSMGQGKVELIRQPRIGVMVTGDEIIDYCDELIEGKIYDTNGILLGSRLRELGLDFIKIDTKKDDYKAVSKSILENIQDLDLIITTGGVSVGDKDIFHDVIDEIHGNRLFWRVRLKPGTPMMYTLIGKDEKPMLSLSGNPFASLATFEVVARPLISKLSHDRSVDTKRVKGVMKDSFAKKSKVRRFVRCIYEDGEVFFANGGHASGMLLSMKDCNALIEIEEGNEGLEPGDLVNILLL